MGSVVQEDEIVSGISGWDILFGLPAVFVILVIAWCILDAVFEYIDFFQLLWYIIVISSFNYLIWRFST